MTNFITEKSWLIVVSCAIWYHFHLYDLKNVKNTHGELLVLAKLQEPATLLKVTLLYGSFSRFLNCTSDTKSPNPSHLNLLQARITNYTRRGGHFSILSQFSPMFHFYNPWKPLVFWSFQGVRKLKIVLKIVPPLTLSNYLLSLIQDKSNTVNVILTNVKCFQPLLCFHRLIEQILNWILKNQYW